MRSAALAGVLLGLLGTGAAQGASVRLEPRVVGGSTTPITVYPFQVALYSPSAGSRYAGQFCGGAILDATHVATAAHCVFDDTRGQAVAPQSIRVIAGTASLDSGGQDVGVAITSLHPKYDPSTADYDVAVLTLAGPLFSDPPPSLDGASTVAPIPLMTSALASYASPGSPVRISGWGETNPQPSLLSNHPHNLQAVTTKVVSQTDCENAYAASGGITPRMICAGEFARDSSRPSAAVTSSSPPVTSRAAATPSRCWPSTRPAITSAVPRPSP